MNRLSKEEYFMRIADLVKQRGTCPRRQVGCVIVDEHFHILSTGYNGNAKRVEHCYEVPCDGYINPGTGQQYPTGEGLELCEAIHAEQNALLQCTDVMKIMNVYCTDSPCIHCLKLLMNTSVKAIYYDKPYVKYMQETTALAEKAGIELIHWPLSYTAGAPNQMVNASTSPS